MGVGGGGWEPEVRRTSYGYPHAYPSKPISAEFRRNIVTNSHIQHSTAQLPPAEVLGTSCGYPHACPSESIPAENGEFAQRSSLPASRRTSAGSPWKNSHAYPSKSTCPSIGIPADIHRVWIVDPHGMPIKISIAQVIRVHAVPNITGTSYGYPDTAHFPNAMFICSELLRTSHSEHHNQQNPLIARLPRDLRRTSATLWSRQRAPDIADLLRKSIGYPISHIIHASADNSSYYLNNTISDEELATLNQSSPLLTPITLHT